MKLLLQKDVFTEDETADTEAIIGKYFDVVKISDEYVAMKHTTIKDEYGHLPFRGSLALYQAMRKDKEFSNALNWMPALKKYLVSNKYVFMDLNYAIDYASTNIMALWNPEIFCRPVSGMKEFSGGVFTAEKLQREADFMKQNKNIDDTLICVVAQAVPLDKEYRCVFANNGFVSACQYMVNGEKELVRGAPEAVIAKAHEIAEHPYFINKYEFVLDIATTGDNEPKLIEINEFNTASFYACDLDKIYKTYASSF